MSSDVQVLNSLGDSAFRSILALTVTLLVAPLGAELCVLDLGVLRHPRSAFSADVFLIAPHTVTISSGGTPNAAQLRAEFERAQSRRRARAGLVTLLGAAVSRKRRFPYCCAKQTAAARTEARICPVFSTQNPQALSFFEATPAIRSATVTNGARAHDVK